MSRTIRRTKFNKKNRFFHHYWEAYSDKEINGLAEIIMGKPDKK